MWLFLLNTVHFPYCQHWTPPPGSQGGVSLVSVDEIQAECGQILYSLNACIVCFQGKGIPDLNTRLLVKKLWDTFHIPVFTLVDADPHGNLSWTILDNNRD